MASEDKRRVLDKKLVERLRRLATTNVSDALDKLGLKGTIIGILPMFECPKLVGQAVTIEITAAGLTPSEKHLGIDAIEGANQGDIIVIDNSGRTDVACWGELLSIGAKNRGIAGVVIDGAFRDLDAVRDIGFPVYARCVVPTTARGRIMQKATNVPIQCAGVQVRPADMVIADGSGVVIVPAERVQEVLKEADALYDIETEMARQLRKGRSIAEVDREFKYEKMLKKRGKD